MKKKSRVSVVLSGLFAVVSVGAACSPVHAPNTQPIQDQSAAPPSSPKSQSVPSPSTSPASELGTVQKFTVSSKLKLEFTVLGAPASNYEIQKREGEGATSSFTHYASIQCSGKSGCALYYGAEKTEVDAGAQNSKIQVSFTFQEDPKSGATTFDIIDSTPAPAAAVMSDSLESSESLSDSSAPGVVYQVIGQNNGSPEMKAVTAAPVQ